MRKSSSRNQRSKGINAKHILQICVLLGVCIWLVYQLKYSHEKKKEFYEKDAKASTLTQIEDGIIKLGRKDLPQVQEVSKNENHEEDDEEENKNEEEEEIKLGEANERHDEEEKETSKHEEEEQEDDREEEEEGENKKGEEDEVDEEESKHGEEQETVDDDTRGGDGDDEIDEQDQDKTAENEDEFIEEDKEREGDDDEKDTESDKREEEAGEEEEESQVENGNNHDEADTANEAREEHYKADDASSAVSHDTHVVNTKPDKESSQIADPNVEGIALEQENKTNNTEEISREQKSSTLKSGKVAVGIAVNTSNVKEKDEDSISSDSRIRRTTESVDQFDATNETAEAIAEKNSNLTFVSLGTSGSEQDGTETTSGKSSQERNKTEVSATPIEASNLQTIKAEASHDSDAKKSDSKVTISVTAESTIQGQSSNLTSESDLPEKIATSNATPQEKENSEPSTSNNAESSHGKNSDGTEENSGLSSTNVSTDRVENDPVDISDNTIPHEVKEALTEPGTLPDIKTDGIDNEEVAAE